MPFYAPVTVGVMTAVLCRELFLWVKDIMHASTFPHLAWTLLWTLAEETIDKRWCLCSLLLQERVKHIPWISSPHTFTCSSFSTEHCASWLSHLIQTSLSQLCVSHLRSAFKRITEDAPTLHRTRYPLTEEAYATFFTSTGQGPIP